MLPAPAYLISYPFCGTDKKMMSIAGGNTFGGTVWSDTRRHYPMLRNVAGEKGPFGAFLPATLQKFGGMDFFD